MMRRITSTMVWLVLSSSSFAHAQEVDYAALEVRVEGIQHQKRGEVGVALFNSPKGYPAHTEHSYDAKWVPVQAGQQSVHVAFEGVPFGEYAVSVLHDENGNRKLERSPLGFPKEGVGFSNDQKVILSAPSFKASKLTLSEPDPRKLTITLDYRD